MPLGEFELIERFFRQPAEAQRLRRGDVPLGIGDDAALLQVPAGLQLVAALDTLVEGRHFLPDSPPESIGHRALAVNLSDLAAMGATPAWYLLSLTLPTAEESFLAPFSQGMQALADAHGVALVGGNTTGGPRVIAVQALGFVAPGMALTRSGARPGDLLYVSGTPGDAAAGLRLLLGQRDPARLDPVQRQALLGRFHFPTPRVALGQALAGLATACVDVSDGLAADASRLARASGCALTLAVEQLPVSAALVALEGDAGARRLALTGGEDCELCFAVAPGQAAEVESRADIVKCPVTRIGRLEAGEGARFLDQGQPFAIDARGFDHFANPQGL